MSAIENILGMLPDRVGDGKNSQIYTPPHIAQEMVNALPEDIWNKDTTFLDICCKSGIFLYKIYQKLMESPSMVESFPDETDRATHIIHKQLFGIAPSIFCQMFSTRTVYGYLDPESHIISINEYELVMRNADKTFLYKTLQKEFNTVKFDIVIGNPPYNNDAYLDFVQLGHQLSNKYTMMITPAKWQAKGGAKNEQFRKEIVPYMSEIVYYPCCREVFDITCQGGISYYRLDKTKQAKVNLKTVCNTNQMLDSNGWQEREKIITLYSKEIENIIKKINSQSNFNLRCEKQGLENRWNVLFTDLYIETDLLDASGMATGTCKIYYKNNNIKDAGATVFIKSFDTEDKAKSMVSFLETKTIRFCFVMGQISFHASSDACWRFIPAPEAFDHIFTDAELYKKYNLTEEEINIIESVIKERK